MQIMHSLFRKFTVEQSMAIDGMLATINNKLSGEELSVSFFGWNFVRSSEGVCQLST